MIIFEKVYHYMFGIIYLTPGNPVTLGDPSATSACVATKQCSLNYHKNRQRYNVQMMHSRQEKTKKNDSRLRQVLVGKRWIKKSHHHMSSTVQVCRLRTRIIAEWTTVTSRARLSWNKHNILLFHFVSIQLTQFIRFHKIY